MKLLVIFLLFTAESIAFAEIIYACSGGTVLFPWNSNNKTELTTDVKWFHRMNNGLHNMVALFTNRMFLSADGRMSRLADNRLSLRDVTVNDTGLYHVEVKYTDNTLFNFTFYLQVSDSPMVRDQQLQVTQDSVALWNKTSSQWTIRLLCGTFTFQGNDAPIQVEWILPDKRTRVSNDYEKGQFYLTLSAPMKDDKEYTCRIPKRYYPNICLTGKTKAYALTEASLFVEEGKTKLIMLEAEQERMKDVIANLTSALAAKEQKFSTNDEHLKNAIDNLNSIVVAKAEKFRTSDERLKNAVDKLNSSVVAKAEQFRTSDERLKNAVDKLNSSAVAKEQKFSTSDERLNNAIDNLNRIVVAKAEQFRTSDERLKNAVDKLNSSVVAKEKDFRTSDERLKNAVDNLKSDLYSPVIFSATAQEGRYSAGQALLFNNIIIDNSHIYNSISGITTIPRNGTYFIYLRCDPPISNSVHLRVMVNSVVKAAAFADNGSPSSGAVALYLHRGDRVWAIPTGKYFVESGTAFTIVRVSP